MKAKSLLTLAASIVAGFSFAPAAVADPVPWSGNGHYYEFVAGGFTWFDSTGIVAFVEFSGVPGHLATITSAAENDFLNTTFHIGGTGQFAWTAGALSTAGGVWIWKGGPEFGTQFSNGATPTPPFNYANWGGTEPNGSLPLQYMVFNLGDSFNGVAPGQWADMASEFGSPTPNVVGYIVEYEVPEPSTFALLTAGGIGLLCARRRKQSPVRIPIRWAVTEWQPRLTNRSSS